MSLEAGDRVRVRLNDHCREEVNTLVTAGEKSMYKRKIGESVGHRPEAHGKLGRIIRIVPGSQHCYDVLYTTVLGQEDPIKIALPNRGQQLIMGGSFSASELTDP